MENKNDKANSWIDNIKTRASCRSGDTILISNNNETLVFCVTGFNLQKLRRLSYYWKTTYGDILTIS